MRDGALPAIALCLALGLALSHSSWRAWLTSGAALTVAAVTTSVFAVPLEWQQLVVLGCWAGCLLCCGAVYLGRPASPLVAGLVAAAAGMLIGALTSEIGQARTLVLALPWLAVFVPGAWLVRQRYAIVVKVLTSWLLAVAILSAGLTVVAGPTAGADHLE